jgi:hypothetical protein
VIPSKRPTAAEKQKDKVGKSAFNPGMKDLLGSRPTQSTLEQVEKMIAEPLKPREIKKMDYAAMAGKNFRTKKELAGWQELKPTGRAGAAKMQNAPTIRVSGGGEAAGRKTYI